MHFNLLFNQMPFSLHFTRLLCLLKCLNLDKMCSAKITASPHLPYVCPDTGVVLLSWSVPQLRPAVPCAPAHVSPGVLSCPAHTAHTSAHTAVRSVRGLVLSRSRAKTHTVSFYCLFVLRLLAFEGGDEGLKVKAVSLNWLRDALFSFVFFSTAESQFELCQVNGCWLDFVFACFEQNRTFASIVRTISTSLPLIFVHETSLYFPAIHIDTVDSCSLWRSTKHSR